jgi:hypothetical protein
MKRSWILFLSLSLAVGLQAGLPSIKEKTSGMEKQPGFFTYYWDESQGELWLEIDKLEEEFLYVNSLPAGLGSNDIGLDRNQLGRTRIVKFQRIGPKLLMIQPNYGFRALSDNPDERKAVEDAFARSVIWGFTVEAEENSSVLVNVTEFVLSDAHGVVSTLERRNEGSYKLDPSRSAVFLPGTKNFPLNTEMEALLTFTGQSRGRFVGSVAPDSRALTVRMRHSFIVLPDDEYRPRIYDPRSSFGSAGFMDFAAPIEEPLKKRIIVRHRLRKKDPAAETSEAIEPIVYYVDRGAPEPVRSALIEGARWWNEAFEAIGYKDAFQVRLLPEGADPMDIRYNVINWVHRSTRGWSYGSSVTDPRTGEIIKGHVSLGSQRVRQDFLIAQGLIGDYEGETSNAAEMKDMALARIRQLSCHEVGHTLGLGHNYASSVNERASVMDYPHPYIGINGDGILDLSRAYTEEIGEWDKVSIAFGYQDYPPDIDEHKAPKAYLDRAFEKGLLYLADQDARGEGSAHPLAHLWDNGRHPTDELLRMMKVRSIALNGFSQKRIPPDFPMATLEDVLVPVYLCHRYQIQAASKVLGGLYYNHTLRGGPQSLPEIVPAREQRRALEALLSTLKPENLAIRKSILELIPPRPPGYSESRELFQGYTGPTFDPLAAAESAAQITVSGLCNAQRAARLVDYHARNNDNPGLSEVLDRLIEVSWKSKPATGVHSEIQRMVNGVVLKNLIRLAADEATLFQVRAVVSRKLDILKSWLEKQARRTKDEDQEAHYYFGLTVIDQFQQELKLDFTQPLQIPQGEPIGMGD